MMKLMKGLRFGALILGVLAFASCNKDSDDDGGGNTDTQVGNFSATIQNTLNGEQGEWTGLTTVAEYNTETGRLSLTSTNSAGDVIFFTINDNEPGAYTFTGISSNMATYTTSGSSDLPLTTLTTNPGVTNTGTVVLTTYDEENLTISSDAGLLKFYSLVEDEDDVLTMILSEMTFSDVPVTVTGDGGGNGGNGGNGGSGGGETSISANIDGTAFDATLVQAVTNFGLSIVGISGGSSITVRLPEDATTGTYDMTSFSPYTVTYASGSDAYSVDSGTMVVTAVDISGGTATGTFNATLSPVLGGGSTIEITNGSFHVN